MVVAQEMLLIRTGKVSQRRWYLCWIPRKSDKCKRVKDLYVILLKCKCPSAYLFQTEKVFWGNISEILSFLPSITNTKST